MIQQVLNREFLCEFLYEMRSEIELSLYAPRRRDVPKSPLDEFSASDIRELLGDIREAGRNLSSRTTPASRRRGLLSSNQKRFTPSERLAYIEPSPEVSNLQAAIEEYFRTQRPDVVEESSRTKRHKALPLQAGERLSIWKEQRGNRRIFRKFEQTDIRWVGAKFAEGMRSFRGKHPFVPLSPKARPVSLDPNTRIIIVGDWGSGIPRAQHISKLIRGELDYGIKKNLKQHVIHLGDVYYAGWKYEYVNRFLKYWPVKDSEADRIGSFTLNGNHDMYSGGHHYFGTALADRRFKKWQRGRSLFVLSNSTWLLFGIDTAYEDGGLEGDQANWINSTAACHPHREKVKVVLLSHHQYCSSYESPHSTLINKIQRVLTDPAVNLRAWLWGHEHRCITYQAIPAVPFASCIGHGGVPVYQLHAGRSKLPSPGKYEFRDVIYGGVGGIEPWAQFGFAVLDFERDELSVRYIGESGKVVHRETIR
jgi:hypothetical protein